MLDNKELIKVSNISDGPVVYSVPELRVRREFQRGETKQIPVEELIALHYTTGGMVLIREFLSVDSDELLMSFGIIPEPEYKWTAQDVKELLLNGSLEQLQDCLEFAPAGIVETVKDMAVSLKINDMSKRQTIQNFTGFNVSKGIDLTEDTAAKGDTQEKPKARRVPPKVEAPTVKTNYHIVEE